MENIPCGASMRRKCGNGHPTPHRSTHLLGPSTTYPSTKQDNTINHEIHHGERTIWREASLHIDQSEIQGQRQDITAGWKDLGCEGVEGSISAVRTAILVRMLDSISCEANAMLNTV